MLKRWAAWPQGIRWLAGIAAVVLTAAIVWALFVPLADWLARHDVGPAKPALLQTARDAARGRLLTLVTGLFAAGALVFTARNFNLSREGQVTDRYTKAVEQLGSKELDVRIGGIYALERVARDSAKDHPTVMEVLTAFIRDHSREQWPLPDTGSPEQERLTRPDVQAAVRVVGRRDAKRDVGRIDLTGADLPHATLRGADLGGRNRPVHLGGPIRGAHLRGAILRDSDLVRAYLTDADLTRADLVRADLTIARLTRADLSGADLSAADLSDSDLTYADLRGADLSGADLSGADLTYADLAAVRWPEGAPVPDGWMVDSESGRLRRTASYQG